MADITVWHTLRMGCRRICDYLWIKKNGKSQLAVLERGSGALKKLDAKGDRRGSKKLSFIKHQALPLHADMYVIGLLDRVADAEKAHECSIVRGNARTFCSNLLLVILQTTVH